MRGLTRPIALSLLVLACGRPALAPSSDPLRGYLSDALVRRARLEADLVHPKNGYSTLRLAHYASGDDQDWDRLPEWNPKAAPWVEPIGGALEPLAISPAARAGDPAALRALGAIAFERYPVQISPAAERAIHDERSARSFGLCTIAGRVGGLVKLRTDDGVEHVSYSCATCHSAVRDGKPALGVACDTLDVGRLTVSAFGSRPGAELDRWGPGRVDVTTDDGTEPVRIPDLRPIRDVQFLHHTASFAQHDVVSLAVRLETLVIVSNGRHVRPPREVTLGLALYLWSLADQLPRKDALDGEETRGAGLFAAHCASCHGGAGFGGGAVPVAVVGTDGHLGASRERGTGRYRVPSLRGVSSRGLLLHDASISGVDELLDPARLAPDYRGRLGGPIAGHEWGTRLSTEDRGALAAFLRSL